MTHWASPLIGKPWLSCAEGPDAFDCWGLVRWVFEHRHGVSMPRLALNRTDNVPALIAAASVSGWRPVSGPPAVDDIVLMRGRQGRHVGVMIFANGRLGVLHANGTNTPKGPKGQVVFQSLAGATADGYGDYEFWRRT